MWEALPELLIARIVFGSRQEDGCPGGPDDGRRGSPSARLVCSTWRTAHDNSLGELRPPRWPAASTTAQGTSSCLLTSLDVLDLSSLPQQAAGHASSSSSSASASADPPTAQGGGSTTAAANDGAQHMLTDPRGVGQPGSSSSTGATQPAIDLLGAAVLTPKALALAETHSDDEAGGAASCVVSVSRPSPLTAVVASMWEDAAPLVTPAPCLRLWRALPSYANLRELRLSGSMLLVASVGTSVSGCSDAAAGLQQLQQLHHAAAGAPVATPGIVHTYTLRLPDALCSMTGLQRLSIRWELQAGEPPQRRRSHEQQQPDQAAAMSMSGGSIVIPGRRRSYEGGDGGCAAPSVRHAPDTTVVLPRHFGALACLQQLELGGCIPAADSLLPLLGMSQLRALALGPGRLNMDALRRLAAGGGVVAQLSRLTLRQAAAWDVPAMVAVLQAARQLQELEVDEIEMSSTELAATGALAQGLTAADVSALSGSLSSITWSTCSQRLLSGASLLCRNTQAPDPTAAVAGPWLGGLAALSRLQLRGVLRDGSVLGAPALDGLSAAIGACKRLQELHVAGLGLPHLPEELAQLPHLHTVRLAAASVTRRSAAGAEAALAVLGRCRGLRRLALSGCELREPPTWLPGLARVTALQLGGNYIQLLPAQPCLGLPPGVRELDLGDNRLRELGSGIAGLTALRRLRLAANYLTHLPAAIWDLPALQELSVRENMLHELPECVHPQQPPAAGEAHEAAAAAGTDATGEAADEQSCEALLDVVVGGSPASRRHSSSGSTAPAGSRWQLTHSPRHQQPQQQCPCGSSLRVLELAGNQLAALPASISALTALQHLDVADNHLTRLPPGVGRLLRLRFIDCEGNRLPTTTSLPPPPLHGLQSSSSRPAAFGGGASGAAVLAASASKPARPYAAAAASRLEPRSLPLGDLSAVVVAGATPACGKLPCPLGQLPHLEVAKLGRQQVESSGRHGPCPLSLLLAGLGELAERLRCLAPPKHHQCPVSRAAAAAMAHLTGASRPARQELLDECANQCELGQAGTGSQAGKGA